MPTFMSPSAVRPGALEDVFQQAGPEVCRLFRAGAESAGLTLTDFLTIQDLLELSGYQDDRPLHALLLVLMLALQEGSLCVEASEENIARILADLVTQEEARGWSAMVARSLENSGYPELIGRSVDEGKPVVLYEVSGNRYIYVQKYLKYEQTFVKALRARLSAPHRAIKAGELEGLLGAAFAAGGGPQLNVLQKRAVGLGLSSRFLVVSGGPGTGKTSIVRALVAGLTRLGIGADQIALAAPTGRAAQRLADSLGDRPRAPADSQEGATLDSTFSRLQPRTLHQLLGYQPSRGTFRYHAQKPIPAQAVIVDEVSMVGLELMTRLFEATASDATLILLGDKDQLPSVEAGALLAHLVPDGREPEFGAEVCARLGSLVTDLPAVKDGARHPLRDALVVLKENHRSAVGIQEVARAVNDQDLDVGRQLRRWKVPSAASAEAAGEGSTGSLVDLEREGGCWLVEPGSAPLPALKRLLHAWADHHFLSGPEGAPSYHQLVDRSRGFDVRQTGSEQHAAVAGLFELLGRSRMLTLLREGSWGCIGINAYVESMLRRPFDGRAAGALFGGAPVLVTRNEPARQLYNGDVGLTLRDREGALRVVFQRPGPEAYAAFAPESLPAHELAFALTVHKSQGSQYDHVLLVIPPSGGKKLLTKELVYTAITRARTMVVVYGSLSSLETAVSRRIHRQAALLSTFQG